jgi:hypothetical protein
MGSLGQTVIRHPFQTCIYRDQNLCILDCHVLWKHALPEYALRHWLIIILPLPTSSTSLLLVVDNIITDTASLSTHPPL